MSYKLLVINPGSTSTKIGVYEDEKELFEETLRHTNEEIKRYDTIYDQFGFRKELILKILKEKNFDTYYPNDLNDNINALEDLVIYFLLHVLKPLFTKSNESNQAHR